MAPSSNPTYQSRSDRVTPPPRNDTPLQGWAVALQSAKARNKKKPCSKNRLSIAKTAFVLRQWQLCKTAAEAGLSKGGASEEEMKHFKDLLKKSKEELDKKSYLTRNTYFTKTLVPMLLKWECNLDRVFVGKSRIANLNNIHDSAYSGDVCWLEAAIAIGASIDFPVLANVPEGPHPAAPKNCTALLLAMGSAAFHKQFLFNDPSKYEEAIDAKELLSIAHNAIRCAVILVMQGADLNRRLEMPNISEPVDSNSPCGRFKHVGIMGMSVKELAAVIEDEELLEAIKLMEEAPKDYAWCRCGSRLRWTECHAAPSVLGQHAHCVNDAISDGNARLCFRLSPLAPCPCKVSRKINFDCCGWMASHPQYQNDTTGKYLKKLSNHTAKTPHAPYTRSARDALAVRPTTPPGYQGTYEDYKAFSIGILRISGIRTLESMLGPKSNVLDWDTAVYTGVMERLDKYFLWTDAHYMLEKAELLKRVEEWNTSLKLYCDDKGMAGPERQRVIRKHRARPFAPCANLTCTKVETSIKQYNRCSNCKTLAYCSRECQKEHWKVHKLECED